MPPFPAPVSGQPIPRGWFARLVRFMNSLILHGDGSYTEVKHTDAGTFVTLTAAARDALDRATGRPGGSGGGGGFPDLTSTPTPVDVNQTYNLTADMWLIGRVYCASYGTDVGSFYLDITKNGSTKQLELFHIDNSAKGYQLYFENFISLPLRAGLSISFTRPVLAIVANLSLYPSI